MSRDSNGNYALPVGNPVISGTPIESAWANSTMSDIAAALTDSLSRSGQGGMLVPFRNTDGNVAAPGMTWQNMPTSGIFRDANGMAFSWAGVEVFRVGPAGPAIGSTELVPDVTGTAQSVRIEGAWALLDAARVWEQPQRTKPLLQSTLTLNLSMANDFLLYNFPTGALTFNNVVDGQRGMIMIYNTNGVAITLGPGVSAPQAMAADISTVGNWYLSYWVADSGNVFMAYTGPLV